MCVSVCNHFGQNCEKWNISAVSHRIFKIFCMDTQWVVPNFFVFGVANVAKLYKLANLTTIMRLLGYSTELLI